MLKLLRKKASLLNLLLANVACIVSLLLVWQFA